MAASRSSTSTRTLDRPGVQLEGLLAPGGERGVEDVERVEGLDALHQVRLRHPVERARGEAAREYLAALLEERPDLLVDRHVAREGLVQDLGVAAGAGGHQHAGAVQD